MDKNLLSELSKKASELWMACEYEEAEKYYEKVYPHIGSALWGATGLYTEYALTLEKLGKMDEAKVLFEEAVSSAIHTDTLESAAVTLARFGLGEYFFRQKQYDNALLAINPSLVINCEAKWLVYFLAAQINYKQSNSEEFERSISAVLFSAPKGKYKNLNQIRRLITNE